MADFLTDMFTYLYDNRNMIFPAIPGAAAVLLSLYNSLQMRRGANLVLERFVEYGLNYPIAMQKMNNLPPTKYLYLPIVVNNTGYKAGMITDINITAQCKSKEKFLTILRRVELHKQEGSDPLVYTKKDYREVLPSFPVYAPAQESTLILVECEDEEHDVLPINEDITLKVTLHYGKKSSTLEIPFKTSSVDLDKSLNSVTWVSAVSGAPDPTSDSEVLRNLLKQTPKEHRYEDILNRAYIDKSTKFNGRKIGKLDLINLELPHLPSNIGQFSELKELKLKSNRLSSLPIEIGSLRKLERLYLSNNVLRELPDSIGNLRNLKELFLMKNQLESLPESIGNLTNLETLVVYENNLKTIPESIGKLKNLKYLYINRNELVNLPRSITELVNLEDLWLGENQLSSVPDDLDRLTNLVQISLSGNPNISSLPINIGNMKKLKAIDVRKTSVSTLPESFFNLKNDIQLCYDGTGQFEPMVEEKIKNWVSTLTNQGFKVKYTAMALTMRFV